MRRCLKALVVIALACGSGVLAQSRVDHWGQRTAAYDGKFTFVRLRWKSGTDGWRKAARPNNYWLHEFPRAEQNLMAVLRQVTEVDANTEGGDRKSTRLNSSHIQKSRMPSSA